MSTLRYQFTEDSTITSPVLKGWTDLYDYDTDYSSDVSFGFNQPVTWDGESNILFDLSIENSGSISCHTSSSPDRIIAIEPQGKYVNFDGGDHMELLASSLQDVSDQVTLELWLRGDDQFHTIQQYSVLIQMAKEK